MMSLWEEIATAEAELNELAAELNKLTEDAREKYRQWRIAVQRQRGKAEELRALRAEVVGGGDDDA